MKTEKLTEQKDLHIVAFHPTSKTNELIDGCMEAAKAIASARKMQLTVPRWLLRRVASFAVSCHQVPAFVGVVWSKADNSLIFFDTNPEEYSMTTDEKAKAEEIDAWDEFLSCNYGVLRGYEFGNPETPAQHVALFHPLGKSVKILPVSAIPWLDLDEPIFDDEIISEIDPLP